MTRCRSLRVLRMTGKPHRHSTTKMTAKLKSCERKATALIPKPPNKSAKITVRLLSSEVVHLGTNKDTYRYTFRKNMQWQPRGLPERVSTTDTPYTTYL